VDDAPRVSVPSPCRDVCRLDEANVCIGCGRTAGEIQEWPRATNARRLLIRAAARARIEQESEAEQRGKFGDWRPL
jgi:predicted Fe-S protein YdhL (DUF1289 family)